MLSVFQGDVPSRATPCSVASNIAFDYGWECSEDIPEDWRPLMSKVSKLDAKTDRALQRAFKRVWDALARNPHLADAAQEAGLRLRM